MASPIRIRAARRSDIRAVAALWGQMMHHHRGFDSRFATASHGPQAFEGYLRRCLRSRNCRVFLAEAGGAAVGYAIVTVLENHRVFALGKFGFVAEMCVDERVRRQGVGRRLWEAAVAWCRERGLSVVQMNVSTLNGGARKFWRSMGCREYLEVLWYDIPPEGGEDPGPGVSRNPPADEEF